MRKKKNRSENLLLAEIQSVSAALTHANHAVEQCTDPLLLESIVYEIKYLQTRHAYLMNMARKAELSENVENPANIRGELWKKFS